MYVFKYSVTKHEFVSLLFSLCRLFFACLEECYDYIRVYDVLLYPLLGEIREYTNKQFSSSSNDLTVLFYSDGSASRRGFHANWFLGKQLNEMIRRNFIS